MQFSSPPSLSSRAATTPRKVLLIGMPSAGNFGGDMAKIVITIEDGDEPGSVKLGIDMPALNPMADAFTVTPAQHFAVEVLEMCHDIKRREEEE